MANATMGHTARWAVDVSNADPSTTSFDLSTQTLPFLSSTVGRRATITTPSGMRGSRGVNLQIDRVTEIDLSGTLTIEASPEVLAFFIPHITHDSSSPYVLQETLDFGFDMLQSDGITDKARLFRNCRVGSAQLNFNGDFVILSMDVFPLSVVEDATMEGAALGTTAASQPYLPSELVFTAGNPAAARDIETAILTIDNGFIARRRMGLTAKCYLPGIRTVTLETDAEWGTTTEAQLYGLGLTQYTATLVLTHTAGTMVTSITLTNLQIPDSTPPIDGPDEIIYRIAGQAKKASASGDEISITVDATP